MLSRLWSRRFGGGLLPQPRGGCRRGGGLGPAFRSSARTSCRGLCRGSPAEPSRQLLSSNMYQGGVRDLCFPFQALCFPAASSSTSTTKMAAPAATTFKPRYAPLMHCLPIDQPVVVLDAAGAFEGLADNEKRYAHHLARASFYGGLIVLLQTSLESPDIYRLIQAINAAQDVDDLEKFALEAGLTGEDFKSFLVYCSGIFTNMGNYKGFGDSKFVPDLDPEKFEALVKASKAYRDNPGELGDLWGSVKEAVYRLGDDVNQLGLGTKGVTKYFSRNCTEEDAEKVNRFFKEAKIEGYTNRVLKTRREGKDVFEIRNAGVRDRVLRDKVEFEGADFHVTSGDYGKLLAKVNEELEMAAKYAANDNERNMLEEYVRSFAEGDLSAHKEGSRYWIKNKGPAVETYIGFIETYRDPIGMRGEFEGFVAMVNRDQSAKFQQLVNSAEKLLQRLPWPPGFEKDTFLMPDFTSLDILTFGGSGIPAGINIPNYDEIRQNEGFKNVNLGNVISSSLRPDKRVPFLSLEDHNLLHENMCQSFEVQVGLHELLGHGSGKLLQVNANGTLNFPKDLVNPLTGQPVSKWYSEGETYDHVFNVISSSYEECRAECVGLHLCTGPDVLEVFGFSDPKKQSDIIYANWLSMCQAGIRGLETYSVSSKEWKQAHSQARFVILRVLLEAGQGFVTVKELAQGEDGNPDLLLSMDREKILTVGAPAIAEFLKKLQIYKSTGDLVAAKAMYDRYSRVSDDEDAATPWVKWRDIVIQRKQPKKMFVQANTFVKGEKLELKQYEPSHEGMFRSWKERFSPEEHREIDRVLKDLNEAERPYFAE